jgi:hypothetical protein
MLLAVAGALLTATTAFAQDGGQVLPPTAAPHGVSLAEMAELTGFFNTGSRDPTTLPDTPFQILYVPPNTTADDPPPVFTVRPGTMLYVPVVYSDDAPPIIGDLPDDVTDQAAVANYSFDPDELGAEYLEIVVDGQVTSLGPGYAVGAVTALADGGSRYTTVAAFLTPLAKGAHTVQIRARFTGAALLAFPEFFPGGIWEFEVTFQVVVQ